MSVINNDVSLKETHAGAGKKFRLQLLLPLVILVTASTFRIITIHRKMKGYSLSYVSTNETSFSRISPTATMFPPTTTIPQRKNIGIIISADSIRQNEYAIPISTVQCYGLKHGYHVLVLDPLNSSHWVGDDRCQRFQSLLFARICVTAHILHKYDYLIHLDGDTGVVNPNIRIEDFLTPRDDFDILFEERFHSGEIAAGNYLVKNSNFSHHFLREWADYDGRLPTVAWNNGDNGILHIHLLRTLFPNDEDGRNRTMQCYSLYERADTLEIYDEYVGCVTGYLAKRRTGTSPIRIQRRGHGLARDLWTVQRKVSDVDLFVHAIKEKQAKNFYAGPAQCLTREEAHSWEPDIRPGFKVTIAVMKKLIIEDDPKTKAGRPYSLAEPAYIGHCWPNCTDRW